MRQKLRIQLSCPKCEKLPIRIFGWFLPELLTSDEMIKIKPLVAPYMILNWFGCENQECRNWFQNLKNFSRCPVCELWSVYFNILSFKDKKWVCKNPTCGWSFQISEVD